MKIILSIILSLAAFNVKAQTKYKNVAKFGAFLGSLNLSYERVLDKRSAVAISPALGVFSALGIRYSIGGLGAEYRYYLPIMKKTAPDGFYLNPGIGYYWGNASYQLQNGVRNSTQIGGTAIKATGGFQHIFRNRFVLDVNAGTQYIRLTFKKGGFFANDEAFSGFQPYLGLGFGYAF